MSMARPRRVSHSIASYIFPIGISGSLILWTVPLLPGILAAVTLRDPVPLGMAAVIGLIGVLTIGGQFAPFELRIADAERDYLVSLLDQTPALHRGSEELTWSRFKGASVFRTDSDDITLCPDGRGWIIRGRRHDMLSAAAAINARRQS